MKKEVLLVVMITFAVLFLVGWICHDVVVKTIEATNITAVWN